MRKNSKICLLSCSVLLFQGCASLSEGQPSAAYTLADVDTQVREKDPLFQLMTAQIAMQRGDYKVANTLLQKSMYLTNDPKVADEAMGAAARVRDYAGMYRAARRWLALEPDQEAPLKIAAVLGVGAGDIDASANYLARLAKQHEGGERAGWRYVFSLLKGADHASNTILVVEKLQATYPKEVGLHVLMTYIRVEQNNIAEAYKSIQKGLALAPNDTDVLVAATQVEIKAGRRDAAMKLLADRLDGGKVDSVALRSEYAALLLSQGKVPQATVQYEMVLNDERDNAAALFSLGQIAFNADDYLQASSYFQRLYQVNGYSDVATFYLGRIAEAQKDYTRAIKHYVKVTNGKHLIDAHIGVARMFIRQKQPDDARQHMRNVRERLPSQHARLFEREGSLFLRENDAATALVVYSEALEQHPKVADLYYGRSVVWVDMGMHEQALLDLQSANKLSPNDPTIMNALGYTLTSIPGRYQEAEEYIDQALELLPEAPSVLDSKGWVLYRLGENQASLAYLERAYVLRKDPEIAAHLGEVLWAVGRKKQAQALWQAHKDNRHVQKTMERLLK